MEWMLMPYRRYAEFSGRSRRMEFWMFMLLMLIVETVIIAVIAAGGISVFSRLTAGGGVGASPALGAASFGPLFWIGIIVFCVWLLATIIPYIAVTVRRLHDRNMTGWYMLGFFVVIAILSRLGSLGSLLVFVVEIGWIVILALPGTQGPNKYGPDPLGHADPEVFA